MNIFDFPKSKAIGSNNVFYYNSRLRKVPSSHPSSLLYRLLSEQLLHRIIAILILSMIVQRSTPSHFSPSILTCGNDGRRQWTFCKVCQILLEL